MELIILVIVGLFLGAIYLLFSGNNTELEIRISALERDIKNMRSLFRRVRNLESAVLHPPEESEPANVCEKIQPKSPDEFVPKNTALVNVNDLPFTPLIPKEQLHGPRRHSIERPNFDAIKKIKPALTDGVISVPKNERDAFLNDKSGSDGTIIDVKPTYKNRSKQSANKNESKPKDESDIKPTPKNKRNNETPSIKEKLFDLLRTLGRNWMIALGGLCVALAGVFLAKYSIEQGYLGPLPRILAGAATGLALHLGAEYFRRKTRTSNPIFAVLAGGGSITLFGAILAAMNIYNMVPKEYGFVLLVAVALATMLLAIVHGPGLAAIGIVGAYIVPLFVSTGSGAIPLALVYSVIITAAGLLLLNHMFRGWLWNGVFVGALAWWCMSLQYPNIAIQQGLYLAAIFYLFLAIPKGNWTLKNTFTVDKIKPLSFLLKRNKLGEHDGILVIGLVFVSLLQVFYAPFPVQFPTAIYTWIPLFSVVLLAAHKRQSFILVPSIMILLELIGHLIRNTTLPLEGPEAMTRILFSIAVVVISLVLGARNLRQSSYKMTWTIFITGVPILMALGCYFSTTGITDSQWGAIFGMMTISYATVAAFSCRHSHLPLFVTALLSAHFSASMAAVMVTDNGALTLALALQLIPLAWVIQRYKIKEAGWLFKLLTLIIISRLTLNPSIIEYRTTIHWSLYTYGGSVGSLVLSMFLLKGNPKLRVWAETGAMILFIPLCWSELRFWFHDGELFKFSAPLIEVTLTMLLFTGISFFYHRRSLGASSLKTLYRVLSSTLIFAAFAIYYGVIGLTLLNIDWISEGIGTFPVVNIMLLTFGAPILIGWLAYRFHEPLIRKGALAFSASATFIFINLQIRHIWQGKFDLWSVVSSGELYTYSFVWMSIAIVTTILGIVRNDTLGIRIYQVGMGLLGLVILKIFLIDTANLDGLYRILSFMGLGLSLLGLAYVHQRINNQANPEKQDGNLGGISGI